MMNFIARLLPFILTLSLLGFAGLSVLRLVDQQTQVTELNKNWIENASIRAQNQNSEDLFRSAVAHGIVAFDPHQDRVEYRTLREIRAGLATPLDSKHLFDDANEVPMSENIVTKLLWRNSGAGAEIRKEIDRHQRQRGLVAIRDAGLTPHCAQKPASVSKCVPTTWSLTLAKLAESDSSINIGAVSQFPDPGFFSGLARLTGPASGPWSILSGADVNDATFVLKPLKVMPRPGQNAIIEVVGHDPKIVPDQLNINTQKVPFCLPEGANQRMRVSLCSALKLDDKKAVAYRLTFPANLWTSDAGIQIKSVRIPSLPAVLRNEIQAGTGISLPAGENILRRRLDDRFRLVCDDSQCWPELLRNSKITRVATDLVLAEVQKEVQKANQAQTPGTGEDPSALDPQNLTTLAQRDPALAERLAARVLIKNPFLRNDANTDIELTELSHSLNLEPMLGVPGLDNGSFVNFLENLPTGIVASDLKLTFKPKAQQSALSVMRAFLEDRTFNVQTGSIPANLDQERRAGFVLIDLQNEPGAVRAAVSYPFFNPDIPLWDLQAFSTVAEGRSPASPSVWRGLDARLQPGSSMKVASALSLARSALGMNDGIPDNIKPLLAEAVVGTAPRTYTQDIGFSVQELETTVATNRPNVAPPFRFKDRGQVPYNYPQSTADACNGGNGAPSGKNYGVCEAMARSSNIFFGQMAVYENQTAITALYEETATPRPFTGLGQTLAALDLAANVPLVLLPDAQQDALRTGPAPRIEAPSVTSAPGLNNRASPATYFDFHERNVAINAYGQNVQATPLTMATIAGSVALNAKLKPHIASLTGMQITAGASLFPETGQGSVFLQEIRRGMRAVMLPGGTGYNSFASSSIAALNLRSRVFAKTGTATLGIEGRTLYTHWFVGWINDAQETPRYAFACAISHTTGGSPCPAVTGGILALMAQEGLL
jgi:cell division protein FtsI/penicillin-binding protein 2